METEPYHSFLIDLLNVTIHPIEAVNILAIFFVIFLLIVSALISGSEVAFFSLSPSHISKLRKKEAKQDLIILSLLEIPERLLATILIANNFVNVGIVILSTYVSSSIFDFGVNTALAFVFQVIVITFLLLLFGEIIPKVYATKYPEKFSGFMAYPLFFLEKILRPFSSVLISSTSFVNKRFANVKQNISINDLSDALDLTENEISEDKKILEGIVNFGKLYVKEIMRSRVDVVAVEIKTSFNKLVSVIIESGYSRIPVFSENFDKVKGILYIKDLLPYIHKNYNDFKWQSLIRPLYSIPEMKKIDDLLEEFQSKKIHMAVVVDEYGGKSGIITLEDILEEIVGEITDESDPQTVEYKKIDNENFIFEGKTLLNDFYKIIEKPDNIFDEIKGDADTLAGLILEIKGEIPKKNDEIMFNNFKFKIEAVDNRRIIKIRVHLKSL
ncbi:MAG: gliding motility-associated protein GldE [Bacteroidetes bacterium]|nr:gliding motility-associated protein GldE [Bacteroidota bacterium]MBT6686675.1 gliding motility-associated protein GldE [Bacteroidota bacterium]MBT7144083.1 gliding motility-associated protein GldE [Bacteroidota bacterium]MBT7492274.1 gliding motility-associated protein GldE [Bacteroidota bacterium]